MTGTLPLDVLTTRLQTQPPGEPRIGVAGMARRIWAEGGIGAFWRGYVAAVILSSNPAINYTVFDSVKAAMERAVRRRGRRTRPGVPLLSALELFVAGAVAKAVATIITYPLIRAKVLLMACAKKNQQHN